MRQLRKRYLTQSILQRPDDDVTQREKIDMTMIRIVIEHTPT